jgi:pyruvate formate lyase activating enzyme
MASHVKGCILDIQHFSIQDGPGIRTTVFLKGCPLECLWCHNPEAISFRPEIAVHEEFCVGCGRCLEVCPQGCHQIVDGVKIFKRDLCAGCGLCAQECCSEALVLKGQDYEVAEVLAEVEGDRPFYDQSGGGMTLSGGEPLAQPQFSQELLHQAQQRGIHTVVDTSGYVNWTIIERVLPCTDLFLFDVKAHDPQLHQRLTGVENAKILANLTELLTRKIPLIVRIPVISDCNDQPAEMEAIAALIRKYNPATPVNLLPYHQFAEAKYQTIGKVYRLPGLAPPAPEQLRQLGHIFERHGLAVEIKGGDKAA